MVLSRYKLVLSTGFTVWYETDDDTSKVVRDISTGRWVSCTAGYLINPAHVVWIDPSNKEDNAV